MGDQNLINFAKRILNVRRQLGYSQKDFAAKLNIPNSTLSDIEKARTKATFYFFFNISETFGVNLHYLLHGKGSMFINDNDVEGKKKLIQDIYPDIPVDKNTEELISWLADDYVRLTLLARYHELRVINKEYFDKVVEEKKDKTL